MPDISVFWTQPAQAHLRKLYEHIGKESPKNAHKVVEEIVMAVEKAIRNPDIYAPDKFKTDNDGSYRAFEKHHYRVSYRFANNVIRVLRVRHTSMMPMQY